jgi:arabinose-5-phosphate isomerase
MPSSPLDTARHVLHVEAKALRQMADELSDSFERAVDLLKQVRGRVIVSGMGKSGHIAHKIAATLASTGTPAQFVHPAEASHGDLGMITENDVCLVLSNSGETTELADLIGHARRFAIPMIAITKKEDSTLGRQADITLVLPNAPEACAIGMAPTTSTTCSLALGDALAVALMEARGFAREHFQTFHPGGKLGAQLLRVSDLMHSNGAIPIVAPSASMGETLVEMSTKGFGVVALSQDGRLIGVITDGDLRRNLDGLMDLKAIDVATKHPKTILPDALASEALGVMNAKKITALCVVAEDGQLQGLIQIHDCLRAGVA